MEPQTECNDVQNEKNSHPNSEPQKNKNIENKDSNKIERKEISENWMENVGNMSKNKIIKKLKDIKLSQGALNVLQARKDPLKNNTFYCNDLSFFNVFSKNTNYKSLQCKHFDPWMFPLPGLNKYICCL